MVKARWANRLGSILLHTVPWYTNRFERTFEHKVCSLPTVLNYIQYLIIGMSGRWRHMSDQTSPAGGARVGQRPGVPGWKGALLDGTV